MRDSEVPSFAFLTTDANPLVGSVHPKAMPLILHPEDYESWLAADWKRASHLVAPFPSQLMHMESRPEAARTSENLRASGGMPIDLFGTGG
jgi:putative SOS response-associated peptidase YedK